MTTIHLIGGEKGGEGRSFVCRALIDYHRDRRIPFVGFDTCRSYSDVSRFYTDREGCDVKGFGHEDSLPSIADEVFRQEIDGSVIVNLQTHGMALLVRPWIEEDEATRLSELQRKNAVVWFVSIGTCDSFRLLNESIEYFQGKVPHILVRNMWERSLWSLENVREKFQQVTTKYNIRTIDFPHFIDSKELSTIESQDMPYLEAQSYSDFSTVSRHRCSVFLKRAFAAFESADTSKFILDS